jgi:FKBP12-rapamycin complex-associated protein
VLVQEVSGIEGTFRCTADSVMRVMRDNKESVMAVLEAFVYDPLINWRLLATTKQTMHGDEATNATAAGAAAAAAGADVSGANGADAVPAPVQADTVGGEAAAAAAGGKNPITSNPVASSHLALGAEVPLDSDSTEVLNAKAVSVIARVESKLQGRDFDHSTVLDTTDQVEKLIQQATSHTNLCQAYIGWCPFW